MKHILLIIIGCVVIASCNNQAAEKDSVDLADSANRANIDSPAARQPVKADEKTAAFLVQAADGAMTEVHLGGLAQQKGHSDAVKSFGSMMIHDHSASQERISMMAAQKNITLPATVSDKNQQAIDGLAKENGADFDEIYMAAMVRDHEKDIKLYEEAADATPDPAVKAFITNTLPLLRTHLDSAKAIKKRL